LPGSGRVTWVGHATTLIELDGVALLTDPVLRSRVGPLRWRAPARAPAAAREPDAVLVSHLHRDHADLPSLRGLGTARRLIVPRGAGSFFTRRGFTAVEELAPGESTTVDPAGVSTTVGAVTVTAVPAIHDGSRSRFGHAPAIGFLVEGTQRVYFAGDTDLFAGMRDLGRPDVALLPIWGWGPNLGPGHMDPTRAAEATDLIRPRIVVPIHWGTLYPRHLERLRPDPLTRPPEDFAEALAARGSEAELRVLAPGSSLEI
jgi:L-ascorbate metabolism protein UlaG (beta-lactamase superfamily)